MARKEPLKVAAGDGAARLLEYAAVLEMVSCRHVELSIDLNSTYEKDVISVTSIHKSVLHKHTMSDRLCCRA